jgi:hypothetical protein
MRTTLREKFVLWMVGLALAGTFELLLRSQISPVSVEGVALIAPALLVVGVVAALILRRR